MPDTLPPSPLMQRIQELLIEFGDLRGVADGRSNDDTRDAIRAYQRRSGLEQDGRATEALLSHLEFTTRAIELGARLDAARADQVQAAAAKLLARPETRGLVGGRGQAERADPTRDVSVCFAAPTTACLLNEASESVKAVFDDRFRDWTLGQIVAAEARTQGVDAAFATAARISDPRLVIAALRDIASARAEAGDTEAAIGAAAVIPDDAARARALTAIARAQARRHDDVAVAATVAQLAALAPQLPALAAPVEMLSELAASLGRLGAPAADAVLDAARGLVDGLAEEPREGAKAAVAAALAGLGRQAEAWLALAEITDPNQRRVVLAALAAAAGAGGDIDRALAAVAMIPEPQFRTTVLAAVASERAGAGALDAAQQALDQALAEANSVDAGKAYTRATAIATVARTLAGAGAIAQAEAVIPTVSDGRLRAEALWSLAVAKAVAGDTGGAERARSEAFAESGKLTSALDRVWLLCNAAAVSAKSGDGAAARDALRRALAESQAIGDPWTRSQALVRVAATLESVN